MVWLLMYAYHRTFDKKRALEAKRYYNTEPFEDDDFRVCQERGAQRTFSLHPVETARLIEQALAIVKPHERLAIELLYYEGLTMAEAAARSGVSIKIIEHSYYKGLIKLRKIIDDVGTASAKPKRFQEIKANANEEDILPHASLGDFSLVTTIPLCQTVGGLSPRIRT